jgi:hypothetical protein
MVRVEFNAELNNPAIENVGPSLDPALYVLKRRSLQHNTRLISTIGFRLKLSLPSLSIHLI